MEYIPFKNLEEIEIWEYYEVFWEHPSYKNMCLCKGKIVKAVDTYMVGDMPVVKVKMQCPRIFAEVYIGDLWISVQHENLAAMDRFLIEGRPLCQELKALRLACIKEREDFRKRKNALLWIDTK